MPVPKQHYKPPQKKLAEYNVTIKAIAGDVNDPHHRATMIAAAESLGRLDILINNASTLGITPMPTFSDYPIVDLTSVFQINVIAPIASFKMPYPCSKPIMAL